jgi:hypothetical protein
VAHTSLYNTYKLINISAVPSIPQCLTFYACSGALFIIAQRRNPHRRRHNSSRCTARPNCSVNSNGPAFSQVRLLCPIYHLLFRTWQSSPDSQEKFSFIGGEGRGEYSRMILKSNFRFPKFYPTCLCRGKVCFWHSACGKHRTEAQNSVLNT